MTNLHAGAASMRHPFTSRQLLLIVVPIIARALPSLPCSGLASTLSAAQTSRTQLASCRPWLDIFAPRKRKDRDQKSDACCGIGGANNDLRTAVVIPLDADFAARAEGSTASVASRYRPTVRPSTRSTHATATSPPGLALRALDGRIAGKSYRVITGGTVQRRRHSDRYRLQDA
jgi:hypothetical protein